jgi:mRNA interferase MazF
MRRGEIYRVVKPPGDDPRKHRFFVVVSRRALIESRFSTVICAPIYSSHDGLSTQVAVGIEEGLSHPSSIHCDALMSIPKSMLSNYVSRLSAAKLHALDRALLVALELDSEV